MGVYLIYLYLTIDSFNLTAFYTNIILMMIAKNSKDIFNVHSSSVT